MKMVQGAKAQNPPQTYRYFCVFDHVASPEGIKEAKDFKLEFVLESPSGNAMIIGNQGFSKVTVVNGPYALTFLEVLNTGVVQTTTIVYLNNKAVHSRHTVLDGTEIVPTQYYGTCNVLKSEHPLSGK